MVKLDKYLSNISSNFADFSRKYIKSLIDEDQYRTWHSDVMMKVIFI